MGSSITSWFLADDFSGALEVGSSWYNSGYEVDVGFDPVDLPSGKALYGISSETRNADPEAAANRISECLGRMERSELVYKKVDSTLRGPIGRELTEIAERLPDRPILFAPSNAEEGRSVRGGRLFIDDCPLSESAFRTDPTSPMIEDRIVRIIEATGGPKACALSLDPTVAKDSEMERALKESWDVAAVSVVDASSREDLMRWAEAARKVSIHYLPCGSGGLARALVETGSVNGLGENNTKGPVAVEESLDSPQSRALFVVGSLHPRSREQLSYAREALAIECVYVKRNSEERKENLVDRLSHILDRDDKAVLASEALVESVKVDSEEAARFADCLGECVRETLDRIRVGVVFATGGEIARAIMNALDCNRLALEKELEPGVAVARLAIKNSQTIRLIVKPGGFGGRRLFERVLSRFTRARIG